MICAPFLINLQMSNLPGTGPFAVFCFSCLILVEWVCRTATNKSNATRKNLTAITPKGKKIHESYVSENI